MTKITPAGCGRIGRDSWEAAFCLECPHRPGANKTGQPAPLKTVMIPAAPPERTTASAKKASMSVATEPEPMPAPKARPAPEPAPIQDATANEPETSLYEDLVELRALLTRMLPKLREHQGLLKTLIKWAKEGDEVPRAKGVGGPTEEKP
ncbi:MAG: hypothetical protein KKC37_13060 [Proteobacteria bacterium]|nr:hypothetical protein [Pseudomonadota bacterium]